MKVQLIKEPDNKYDKEAIRCELEPLGKIGYVANSVGTILGNCWSGGRLYDKIGDKTEATVELILDRGAVLAVEAAEPEKPAAEPKPEETTAQTAAAEETLEEKQLGQCASSCCRTGKNWRRPCKECMKSRRSKLPGKNGSTRNCTAGTAK